MFLDIIAIIISIISLLVSAFFTFWNSRPHIKIEFYGGRYETTKKSILIAISYYNASPISGCIRDAYIYYNHKTIQCIQQDENFDLSEIVFKSSSGNPIIFSDPHSRTPISVEPFQCGIGVFVFPIEGEIVFGSFDFYYRFVGNKRFHHLSVQAY